MKIPLRATTTALALSVITCASAGETREDALASLVAAERAFAQASLDAGFKAAFLGVLAEDGTIYQPGPVNGRETVSASPEPPIILSWYPVFADIAASGDLGYTTGPYTVASKDPSETRRGAGHYTSVWRRRPAGAWELVVDLGTPHPAPATEAPGWQPGGGKSPLAAAIAETERRARHAQLLQSDAELGTGPEEPFLGRLSRFAEAGARIYRPGKAPFAGLAAASEDAGVAGEVIRSEPTSGAVSAAGDWAYTLGKSTIQSGDDVTQAHYMRLWRRTADDAQWTLFLDTFAPMPPAPPANGS